MIDKIGTKLMGLLILGTMVGILARIIGQIVRNSFLSWFIWGFSFITLIVFIIVGIIYAFYLMIGDW